MFCLPHYERLILGANKQNMRSYHGDFAKNLTRITGEYSKKLHEHLSEYVTIYDYRSNKAEADAKESRDSVERTVAFLNGRYY